MYIKRKSYAKINYSLKVIEKTKNGYHKLESVMSLIDIYDEITFEESDKIEVHMNPFICKEEDNLCYKVANYLKQFSKENKGIKITINKNIPAGGGLGGGSSNAATVLMFLNHYWKLNFNKKKLMDIAFKFGADIPFFIYKKQSKVLGFGEKVKKLNESIEKNIILIVPNFSLNTKEVFQNLDINNLKSKNNKDDCIINDLEDSANKISKYKIKGIKDIIKDIGSGYALMSGSGSTIIYYIEDTENITEVYNIIKERLPDCKIMLSKMKTN